MELLSISKLFGLCVFAYLLGSIPWGLILTKKFAAVDIRQKGSGNIGAANVMRIAGLKFGLLTLAGDALKGAFPVWLAVMVADSNDFRNEIAISLVALSALAGHLYPIYLKCKTGGKGVATAAGCFLVISPVAFAIMVPIFIIILCWSKRVSAGSLAAAALLPFAVWLFTFSKIMTGCAVVTTILIFFRHMNNITRLLSGTEPVIWGKRGK